MKIQSGSNTIIKQIDTWQKYTAFKGHVLLDTPDEASHIYINNRPVFKTNHMSGLQTVTVNGMDVVIDKLHTYFGSEVGDYIREVVVPKSDVLIEFNGLAAFDLENTQKLTTEYEVIDLKESACTNDIHFDYAVSKYFDTTIYNNNSGIYKNNYKINNLFVIDNKIRFKMHIPCAEGYQNISIEEIKVTLRK